MAVDPLKLQTVLGWPTPTTTRGIRAFLRLVGYYCKFIHHFGEIDGPLTQLLKKEGFLWLDEAELAFKCLKVALITSSALSLPNFFLPFVIEYDANWLGIRAVLSQKSASYCLLEQNTKRYGIKPFNL